ncbi:MAG TPA: VOC family protein, partial [Vicinamibacteria bacterium]|nr:VOC family protein [Vicinamibacteria bacterium]
MATRKTTKARAKAKTAAKTTNKKTAARKTAPKKTAVKKPAAKRATKTAATGSPRARSGGLTLSGLSVSLTVDDLQRSMDFYHHVLGFTITDRWERDGTLMGVEMTAGSG